MRALPLFFAVLALQGQEAESGFDLRATVSGMAAHSHLLDADPRNDGTLTAGVRAMLYPSWKLNRNWSFNGAVQVHTRPYFYEQFPTQGYGIRADVLQGHVTFARVAEKRSLVIRAGQLSTAFGSFPLRYDDGVNPLIDMPISYGYYGRGVTNYGLLGAQVDATLGRLDARAQLTTSSPVNRRGIGDSDQYKVWTGGVGVTIRQGFRVGVSAFRGPYVHREYQYYFPGEAKPAELPGTGYGIDVQWGHGPWNVNGELQRFQLIYRAIPTFNQHAAYAEVRRVLHPRWYVATRAAYSRASVIPPYEIYETGVGFRPNRSQLIKVSYQAARGQYIRGTLDNIFAVQFVTTFRPISIARD